MAEASPKFFDERSDKVDYAEGKCFGHSFRSLNNIYVAFHATFSRHAKAQASLALAIWLNENVLSVGHDGGNFAASYTPAASSPPLQVRQRVTSGQYVRGRGSISIILAIKLYG